MATLNKDLRKAAVLLRCLPSEQRMRLLGRLDSQQAAAVTAELNGLGEVSDVEQEAVVREFAAPSVRRVDHVRLAKTGPFQFLHDLATDALRDLVADEHPQAVALVLSYLPPQQAAALLAELTPEQQFSVVCRIATMNEASPEVVRDVASGLKRRRSAAISRPTGNRGVAQVVKILNVMEPAAERKLLGSLAEADPQLVREIRRVMLGVDVAACEEWDMAEAAG